MCVFSRPKPPPLPEPRPTAPKPQKTAERVVVGQQRTKAPTPGQGKRGQRSIRNPRRLGTSSLRIPLLDQGQMGSGNLNY
tara:strand:- start:652 stop:891 length:240 start_codon:yes stop_codon:yes gene_type:complete